MGIHPEPVSKLEEVRAGVEGVLSKRLRLEVIREEVEGGRAFLRQVESRVEKIVGGAQDEVAEWCRNEGEIFEVGIAVSNGVVENDEPEKLFDFDGVGSAILFQDPSEVFVAAVVLVIFAMGRAGSIRQLAEVFLRMLLTGDGIPVKSLNEVGGGAVLEKDDPVGRCVDSKNLSCDLHGNMLVGGHFLQRFERGHRRNRLEYILSVSPGGDEFSILDTNGDFFSDSGDRDPV